MDRVFISGRISDGKDRPTEEEIERVRCKFEEIEYLLRVYGYNPINPMKLQPIYGSDHRSWMRACIRALSVCDLQYLLPDWEQSKGARKEKAVADILEIAEFRGVLK